jgi:methyl-accepting chemotaxis protein
MAAERHGAEIWAAVCRATNVAQFDHVGHVIWASERFCTTMGYSLVEMKGLHHRAFCSPQEQVSPGYRRLWHDLERGRAASGECTRITKDGREVRLHAAYDPLTDDDGAISGFVKVATDVTERRRGEAERSARLAALDRSQAVVEFAPDGILLHANERFLGLTGYRLEDVVGRHHRSFCDPAYAASADYAAFWSRLAGGRIDSGVRCWRARDGEECWLQASYTPVSDAMGRPLRIVAIASDVTRQVRLERAVATRRDEQQRFQSALEAKTAEVQTAMTQLASVVDTIRSLSAQADLMKLNAAIDAAHAGEAPSGVIGTGAWRARRRG